MELFEFHWLHVAFGVFGFFAVLALFRLIWTRTCLFHHRQKRFIAMDLHGRKNEQGVDIPRCRCFGDPIGTITDHHRFLMRWFCDVCTSMGEHCWDKTGEWKLEHGKIVPDEKKWANRQS